MSSPEDPMKADALRDLWKYFNDRMLTLKDALLQVLSWLMAFALAILGFVVQKDLVGFDSSLFTVEKENAYAAGTFSVLGLLLCAYCIYLIYAYGVLINEHWIAAGRLRDKLDDLNQIFPEKTKLREKRLRYQEIPQSSQGMDVLRNVSFLPPFCKKISAPIIVFIVIFSWILVEAVASVLQH